MCTTTRSPGWPQPQSLRELERRRAAAALEETRVLLAESEEEQAEVDAELDKC